MSELLYRQCQSYIEPQLPAITSISNILAVLYHEIPHVNWAGIYLYNPQTKECILGPFQGKPACMRIGFQKGVVGTCAAQKKPIVVDNVHTFAGHIACDGASNSEIVVPLLDGSLLLGILDIDSDQFSNFDAALSSSICKVAGLLAGLLERDKEIIARSLITS